MELSAPITIYWDLKSGEPNSESLHKACSDIETVRPLMLQLLDPSPSLSEGARFILRSLQKSPVAITLTITMSSLTMLRNGGVEELGVNEILVGAEHASELEQIPSHLVAGVSCPVSNSNWRELPDIVSGCRQRGITRMVLPMQRLYNGAKPFLLTKLEQEQLASALITSGGVEDLKITIHDPFLWRAFNPEVPFPQGGCQAANTMIAITPDKGVYPCPTFPERLGVLGDSSLHDILASPRKKELRRSILLYPLECEACHELAICKGGCRGRSFVLHASMNSIDDACK